MNTTRQYDLVTMGEIMLRLSPQYGERLVRGGALHRMAGSAELNVAAGCAVLGLDTAIITGLPDNDMGICIQNDVKSCGVDTRLIVTDSGPGARLGVYYYEGGASPRKPKVIYDRLNSSVNKLKPEDIPEYVFSSTRCFHTSGITLALSDNLRSTAVYAIKRFKEEGARISFDVNYRANLWSGEQARQTIEQILPYVDYFFCSEDTARLTFRKTGSLKDIMKSFAAEYPISVMASTQRTVHSPHLHSFGSTVYDARTQTFFQEPPYENIEIMDRLGSGDAYLAGALYGLLSEGGSCQKALEYANAASATKNTTMGDLPTSVLRELDSIIRSHQSSVHYEMDR